MATTIPRTPWIDDDGSGTTGTVLNNAIKTELYDQIDAAFATEGADTEFVTVSAAGTYHDFPLSAAKRVHFVKYTGTTPSTFTGFANGKPGDTLIVMNLANPVTATVALPYVNTGSAAPNRLVNIVQSAPTMLSGGTGAINGTAVYLYSDTNFWYLVTHEQGGWITPAFSAAGFTSDVGSWTLTAGAVTTMRYRLSGRSLTVAFMLGPSAVAGSPTQLRIQNSQFGGFTGASTVYAAGAQAYQGTGVGPYFILMQASQVFLSLQKCNLTAWANDAASHFYGSTTFEVT
jgi:hypothetical protein